MSDRISEMFAFVITDEAGHEGVIGIRGHTGEWMPLVGADMSRVESIRGYARLIAKQAGRPVRLLKFTTRETVETIEVDA